jgi:hypothetical protein
MKSAFVSILVILFSLAAFSCGDLDVVARDAVTSFAALTAIMQPAAQSDGRGFELTTADKNKIVFRTDWNGGEDVVFGLAAAPFIDAGLDPAKLPDRFRFDERAGRLRMTFDLGATEPAAGAASLDELFKGVVKNYRDRIGYHEQFNHYGLALGDGNMLEWARDFAANDKDLVFVLDPAPFLAAGLKTDALKDWVFGKVKVKDKDGRPVEVDKLLKPYNLK